MTPPPSAPSPTTLLDGSPSDASARVSGTAGGPGSAGYVNNGPVPLTYVDTGVYEGGGNDYYEAYTEQDLCWASSLNYVLKYHQIPRWEACNHKTKM